MRTALLMLALASSTLVLGCVSFADADFSLVLVNPTGTYPTHVYDSSGLVTAVTAIAPSKTGTAIDWPLADPANNQITVAWAGGDCRRETVLRIDGDPDQLTISVRTDQQSGVALPLPAACDAVGIFLGVTLSLSAPVDQDHLKYVLSH